MNSGPNQHLYNPDWLSDEALVNNFVARMDEFTFLRDELARSPFEGSVQHYLLVGLRGSGKTTLLKRLAVAIRSDADLQNHLVALSFPEELYQVKDLTDFWWASCNALADELDRLKKGKQADQLISRVEQIRANKPASDAGLKLLQQTCAELHRRPVLLVDNLDLLFRRIEKTGRKPKDPNAAAYWALREALSTIHSPIVIGGSVRLSEPFTDYDKAFYDFFIPKHLGKLSFEEVQKVLNHLAEKQNAPEVKQRLQQRPARVASLYQLTGGNLRALGLIFELLRQGPSSRAVADFERLMDITTPYYKARFEGLSEQAQVVMHALAVCRISSSLHFGYTAAELARHAGLPTSTVSAQLEILKRENLVEKTAAHGRTQYRISEQLFRLWLQMRSTRRVRQNVIGLTEFLEAMFDLEEIQQQLGDANNASLLNDTKLSLGVAEISGATSLRKGSEAHGTDYILRHVKEQGGTFNDYTQSGQQKQQENLQVKLCSNALRQALITMDLAALQAALTQLLGASVDVAASLVSRAFVEELLAPLLADKKEAEVVLQAMRDSGYEKYARPMLLAFEVALYGREAMLEELEPEIKTATRRIFERLVGRR